MNQVEPVSAFASSGLALMQPHPVNTSGLLLADAPHKTSLKSRGNLVGLIFGAGTPLDYFEVERVLVTGYFCQKLALFQPSGVLKGVTHGHCDEMRLYFGGLCCYVMGD